MAIRFEFCWENTAYMPELWKRSPERYVQCGNVAKS